MRIRWVTAAAFGPLVGKTLKFADGLTVIFGPNESGKSSWHAAIYAALYGHPSVMPGNGTRGFQRLRPWLADEWSVTAEVELDHRAVQLHQDLLRPDRSRAIDLSSGADCTAEIWYAGGLSAGSWLGLDAVSFAATAWVEQGSLLADQQHVDLQRAVATAAADDTAAAALERIESFGRDRVGPDEDTSTAPLGRARQAVRSLTDDLESTQALHDEQRLAEADLAHARAEAAEARQRLETAENTARARQARVLAELEQQARHQWHTGPFTAPSAVALDPAQNETVALMARDVPALDEADDEAEDAADDEAEDAAVEDAAVEDATRHEVDDALRLWRDRPTEPPSGPSWDGDAAPYGFEVVESEEGDLCPDPAVEEAAQQLAHLEHLAGTGWGPGHAGLGAEASVESLGPDEIDAGDLWAEDDATDGEAEARLSERVLDAEARAAWAGSVEHQALLLAAGAAVIATIGVVLVDTAAFLGAGAAVLVMGALLAVAAGLAGARGMRMRRLAGGEAARSELATLRGELAALRQQRALAAVAAEQRAAVARAERAERAERAGRLARERHLAEQAELLVQARDRLCGALESRGCVVDADDPWTALARYRADCEARQAAADDRRQHDRAERLDEQQRERRETQEAGYAVLAAADLVGIMTINPDEAAAGLAQWLQEHQRRQEQRRLWAERRRAEQERQREEQRQRERRLAESSDEEADLLGLRLAHDRASQAQVRATEREAILRGRVQQALPIEDATHALAVAQRDLERLLESRTTVDLTRDFLVRARTSVHQELATTLTDMLRRWLPQVTDDLYTEAQVDPETLRVKIRGPRRWDDAHLGSHGLAEQVGLLVRVALSRYLCAGQESVPLVLDDVTVQADEQRAERMLELLHGWARHRQVILFTKEEQVLGWARAHQHEPNLDLIEIEAG